LSRSVTFPTPSDQTAFVAAGFESAAGYDGRVYRDGSPDDASAVTVSLQSNPKVISFDNLPEVEGSVYAVTFVASGFSQTLYYPETAFFAHRVIALRVTGQTPTSLGLELYKNAALDASVLSLTEGVAGAGDWIVTGWPVAQGDWALSWEVPGLAGSSQWEIADAVILPPAGTKPPYSLPLDLEVYGQLDGRLGDLLQDESLSDEQIRRATCQADAAIDAALGVCFEVPVKTELSGTWSVVAGSQLVVGIGGAADEETVAGQLVTVGDEHHEILAVSGANSFTLRDMHLGGASTQTVLANPLGVGPLLRRWSSVFTLDRLLIGATDGSESLQRAVKMAAADLRAACDGSLKLPGLVETDSLKGFSFAPIERDFDPRRDLQKQFRQPRGLP
jgi:hypothetical protein